MPYSYSPLRYPGGKSQLYNFILHTFEINQLQNITYCEPFCGGAGIAIKLLLKGKAKHIILNDSDIAIYSIWKSILENEADLIEKILDTPITIDEWYKQHTKYMELKKNKKYSLELGFATFFLNRTNHSGIIEGGPIGGFKQDGKYKLDCRFNKENLIKKIRKISSSSSKISLYNMDAIEFIDKVIKKKMGKETFIFFDPPYFKQGKNLYQNALDEEYHKILANKIESLNKPYWIVTYDNEDKIKNSYKECDGWYYDIRYSVNKKRKDAELLYSTDRLKIDSYDKILLKKI